MDAYFSSPSRETGNWDSKRCLIKTWSFSLFPFLFSFRPFSAHLHEKTDISSEPEVYNDISVRSRFERNPMRMNCTFIKALWSGMRS